MCAYKVLVLLLIGMSEEAVIKVNVHNGEFAVAGAVMEGGCDICCCKYRERACVVSRWDPLPDAEIALLGMRLLSQRPK